MNTLQRFLFSIGKSITDSDADREQRVIKLDDNTYQIVWANEYDNWMRYFKDTGKLK